MTRHRTSASDEAFRRELEACRTPPGDFDHRAHVRLAYVYLCSGSIDEAHGRMRRALLAFLHHVGAGDSKYHETITRAWIMAVASFMAISPPARSAARFIERNPALLDSSIMLRHYSRDVLFSREARQRFVAPDLRPILTRRPAACRHEDR